ncbi:MAG: DUF4446 family protein [Chloroflexi bacterium]|nr:DUF4446 family protein [Chloroflexota bacterium]
MTTTTVIAALGATSAVLALLLLGTLIALTRMRSALSAVRLPQMLVQSGELASLDPVVVPLLERLARLEERQATQEERLIEMSQRTSGQEELGKRLQEDLRRTEAHISELEDRAHEHDGRLQSATRALALRRYNPYPDTGGDYSFVLALLNEHHQGVLLTSLHARQSTRVYAKAVKNGVTESKLTPDEAAALADALAAVGSRQGSS